MKLLLAFATSVALLAAAPYAANAGEQTVIRDSGGRTIGTATSSGNQTTFRDAGGRTTGDGNPQRKRTDDLPQQSGQHRRDVVAMTGDLDGVVAMTFGGKPSKEGE